MNATTPDNTTSPRRRRHRPADDGKVVYGDAQAAALLSGHLAELDEPAKAGWQIVKENVSRTVYRGRIGGQEVYLKHFHSPSLIRRLARRLGVYDTRRELRFAEYLAGRGVPTPPVLAARCDGRAEWLVTRAVAPAEPGDLWHERQLQAGPPGRQAIRAAIDALADLIGRMHAVGVIHRDLHCGNILVCPDAQGPSLVLTDLHRMRRRGRLSRRARAANLAQLLHDRAQVTTAAQRLRFLRRYLLAAGARGSLRGWQRQIEQFARRHTRRQWAHRDRRVLGENRYFSPLRLGGAWRGHVVLASKRRPPGSRAAEGTWTALDWREALDDPTRLMESPDAQVVKRSKSSLVVRRRLTVGGQALDVFIKRARRKQAWKVLCDCFRPARSTRAFKLGHCLLTRRVATALPLAALERRVGPLLLDNLLITEAVDGPHLSRFLATHLGRPCEDPSPQVAARRRQLCRQVLWQLGRLLQRLHDDSFAHRDLKGTNMIVRWQEHCPPEIVLVDLDGLTRRARLTARRRFQGLMRLNVSLLNCPAVNRAGRMRMLKGYLRAPLYRSVDFKRYWRALEDWSARKLQQQIRSRRRRQKAVRRPA